MTHSIKHSTHVASASDEKSDTSPLIYLLIGYMWLFIHRPFEIWSWLAPLRIERIYMLITLAYWLTQSKSWLSCRSNIPVFLLATTYLIAVTVSPYATFETVEDWFKVFVLYVLLITSIRTERDLKLLVVAFAVITALYELHSLREYFNGRGEYRMGTWRMVGVDASLNSPNGFGASADYALPFLFPIWTFAAKRWQKQGIAAMACLAVACVLLTGSRSALAGLLFLAAAFGLTSKYRWRILTAFILIPPLIWVSLRHDLQNRYMTLIDPSVGPENAEESAESRTYSFWYGMKSFAENPIFGAGLESYRARTGFATHNLYNQAMGELGIFGLAVLISFAWSFYANFSESRQLMHGDASGDEVFLYRTCSAALLSCLLLFILGWAGHNLGRYNWLWFGAFSGAALQFLRLRVAERALMIGEREQAEKLASTAQFS